MQETTAGSAQGTGSVTIADIVGLAAERYGERPAARFKRDDEWREVSYTDLAATVSEIARGLIDLGLESGRPRRPAVHDPRRVDVRGLRDHVRGRGRRPDLPDQLARGMRVGRQQLRVTLRRGRGRHPGREDPRRPRAAAEARADRRHRRSPRARSPSTTCASAAARATRRRSPSASRRSSPRIRTRSSTRRGRPGRRRAACSRTAITATSLACARSSTSSRRASPSTSTCRWRTPMRS